MAEIQQSKLVALVPMKANSQRVPEKNFRTLHGKPMFKWILDSLLKIEEIDQIVINTDARDILREIGLVDGGRIHIRDRKPDLCGDTVSMNRILADDILEVEADTYLMTHTTNPMLSAATIRSALREFREKHSTNETDSLFSVNRVQSRFYREDGSPVNHDPDNLIQTQDLEPWLEENSCLYIFTGESFAQTNARIGRQPLMFETPALESVDIDTPDDWNLACAVAAVLHGPAETQQ